MKTYRNLRAGAAMAFADQPDIALPLPHPGAASGPRPQGLEMPPGVVAHHDPAQHHLAPTTSNAQLQASIAVDPSRPSPSLTPAGEIVQAGASQAMDSLTQTALAARNFYGEMRARQAGTESPRIAEFRPAASSYEAMRSGITSRARGASAYGGITADITTDIHNGLSVSNVQPVLNAGPDGQAAAALTAVAAGLSGAAGTALQQQAKKLGISIPVMNGPGGMSGGPTGM